MDDTELRIVDMGPIDGYKRGHIPGAIGLNRNYFKNPDNKAVVMTPDQFADAVGRVGIGNDTNVVAYDDWGGLYATRLWWLLRLHGHQKVWVLNGGWNKWVNEGREIVPASIDTYHSSESITHHHPTSFRSALEPSYNCSLKRLSDSLGKPGFVSLDVRTGDEYTGSQSRGNKRVGHIRGSVHIEWTKTVTNDKLRTFLSPDALRDLFEAEGITPEKEIVTY